MRADKKGPMLNGGIDHLQSHVSRRPQFGRFTVSQKEKRKKERKEQAMEAIIESGK
jgi:ketol-acid reductoisomerase